MTARTGAANEPVPLGVLRVDGTFILDRLMYFVPLILSLSIHEFAHAVTCKHFGGQVHEMGFMLIYFQPAFYCNVSDAWLFPLKRQRLWVSFAGAYAEMVVAAIAAFVWIFASAGSWAHFVSLLVVFTSGLKTLFNLNPLIKLDGYYLLSDALSVPNLRQRSLGYLGMRFRRLLGLARGRGLARHCPRPADLPGLRSPGGSLFVLAPEPGRPEIWHIHGWTIRHRGSCFSRPSWCCCLAPLSRA